MRIGLALAPLGSLPACQRTSTTTPPPALDWQTSPLDLNRRGMNGTDKTSGSFHRSIWLATMSGHKTFSALHFFGITFALATGSLSMPAATVTSACKPVIVAMSKPSAIPNHA